MVRTRRETSKQIAKNGLRDEDEVEVNEELQSSMEQLINPNLKNTFRSQNEGFSQQQPQIIQNVPREQLLRRKAGKTLRNFVEEVSQQKRIQQVPKQGLINRTRIRTRSTIRNQRVESEHLQPIAEEQEQLENREFVQTKTDQQVKNHGLGNTSRSQIELQQPQISQEGHMEQGLTPRTRRTTRNQRVECEHQGHENLEAPQQTTDQEGTSKQTSRGPTYLPHVWARKPNERRIQVDFNKRGQPIGLNKKKLTEFLGTLARNGNFVPIDICDWRKVSSERKAELIKMVKERFDIPEGTEHWILLSIGKKRRNWKERVKKCFNPTLPIENQTNVKPIRVNEDQWKSLLPYWDREDVKEASEKNKGHRKCSVMPQTTGKCSFAEVEEELKGKLGRSPTRKEMFDACYTDSDGNPCNDEVANALTQMRAIRSELPSGSEDSVGPDDSFARVRGKDPKGRVRMLGLGVNASDVWGQIPSRGNCHRMVLEQRALMARMEEKMDENTRLIVSLQEKLQHQHQNPNAISAPCQPISPNQSSNSINPGNRLRVGDTVLLKSLFDSTKTVAKGYLQSVDPNQDVGGTRWCEVKVSFPLQWESDLIRPYSNLSTIGDAVCIDWPHDLVMASNED